MSTKLVRGLFIAAGLYDGILGISFLLFQKAIFHWFGVTPANHPAYIQFPAILLLIFAAMFLRIAQNPEGNKELMLYGIALKAAYSGTVFWYQLKEGIPFMWIPWAWSDLAFLVLFVIAWKSTAMHCQNQDGS